MRSTPIIEDAIRAMQRQAVQCEVSEIEEAIDNPRGLDELAVTDIRLSHAYLMVAQFGLWVLVMEPTDPDAGLDFLGQSCEEPDPTPEVNQQTSTGESTALIVAAAQDVVHAYNPENPNEPGLVDAIENLAKFLKDAP